jgi:hypothetical protein
MRLHETSDPAASLSRYRLEPRQQMPTTPSTGVSTHDFFLIPGVCAIVSPSPPGELILFPGPSVSLVSVELWLAKQVTSRFILVYYYRPTEPLSAVPWGTLFIIQYYFNPRNKRSRLQIGLCF